MKKVLFGCLLLLTAASLVTPAFATGAHGEDDEPGEGKWSVSGELRARWEYLDNYLDQFDDGVPADSLDFTTYRTRFGVTGEFSDNVSARVEIQNFGSWGQAFPNYWQSANLPFVQTVPNQIQFNDTQLYQGYVELGKIFDSNFTVRIGRQEHTLGKELQIGDDDYYNGLTFDGVRAMWEAETWNLNLFHYTLLERSVLPGSVLALGIPISGGSDDATFSGVTAKFDINESQYVEPYLLYYRDGNELGNLLNGTAKMSYYTIGALYNRPFTSGSAFDWSFELALQQGELKNVSPEIDISTYAAEGCFGYHWGDGNRVNFGALVFSGDDFTDPTEVTTFLPLFPDINAGNRLGHSDFFGPRPGGVTSYHLGYNGERGNHDFAFSYHIHMLTDVPAGAFDDLGAEFNAMYGHNYSSNVNFNVTAAMFAPDDAITGGGAAPDDTIMRFTAGTRLRF